MKQIKIEAKENAVEKDEFLEFSQNKSQLFLEEMICIFALFQR